MSKHIFVVEDQEDLHAFLRDFLSASGYTVIEAVDGGDSVAKAASEHPDLVLMDIPLPVLDGYDTRRAKSRRCAALDVSRRQGAKMFELRAATDLARLWHGQARDVEARDLLAPIYGWFTEGFDTVHLKDAKGLLAELSA